MLRRLFLFLIVFISTALLLAGGAASASAHEPIFIEPGAVTQIPDLVKSYAYYQEVTYDTQADTYVFEAEGGQHLHAAISVPKISGMEDFQVEMVLLGPGLPPISGHDLPPATTFSPELGTSAPVCEGFGSGVVCPPDSNGDFFEPFTQTRYYKRQALEIDLPQSGTYHLIVTGSGGATGKYVLDTGSEEEFGAGDLLRLPVWWVKVHVWFGHTPWLIGGLVVLVIAVSAGTSLTFWRKKRPPSRGALQSN